MRPDTFLAGKRHGLRDALSHGGHLAAELMYPGREVEHKRQTMRMRRRSCGGEHLLALVERLVWIAQEPQDTGEIGEGCYPSILPIEEVDGATLLGTVQGEAMLEVHSC
jgi:hypothetical protein